MSEPTGGFAEIWTKVIEDAAANGIEPDVVRGALLGAIPESAANVEANLRRRMPRMLREHRRIRRGFQARLWKRWRRGFDLFEAVIVACQEAGEEVGQGINDEELGRQAVVLGVLRELHARACHVTYQIYALLQAGFPVGAEALWRTLHELDVVANVIANHGPEIAERYLARAAIADAKDAEEYQELAAQLGQTPLTDAEMEGIRAAAEEARRKFGSAMRAEYGWAAPAVVGRSGNAPGIADLEAAVGLDHFGPYRSLGNHRLHAGAKGMLLNRTFFRGEWRVRVQGSNAGFAEVGSGSLYSLVRITITLLLRGIPLGLDPSRVIEAQAVLLLAERAAARLDRIEGVLMEAEAAVIDAMAAQGAAGR